MKFRSPLACRGVALVAAACLVLTGCATPPSATPPSSSPRGLRSIEHIVVIYAENRSFDNLYGLFPGANGISNATAAQYTQTDHDGQALSALPPVWKGNQPDPAFPAAPPNRPFRIDAPPIDLPLSVPTRDLVHKFYQNQEQINGGKLDRYAAVSDAGGLTMGYYDGSALPLWRWARDYTARRQFLHGRVRRFLPQSLLAHLRLHSGGSRRARESSRATR